MAWMIRNQINRRNQTPEQISYFRGKLYEQRKKAPHRPLKGAQNAHLSKTAETIADEYGVNQATIRRDADFAKAIDTIRSCAFCFFLIKVQIICTLY
jgi:hypothetical protein